MKLLRLTPALKPTSSSYNQFSVGLKNSLDQTVCSLNKIHNVKIYKQIKIFDANGSIIGLLSLIRKQIKNNNFNLIHIHNGLTGFIFLIAVLPFNFSLLNRTMITVHNSWNVFSLRNKLLTLIMFFFCKKVCLCSHSSKKSIPKLIQYFFHKKMHLIVNGFNYERIDSIRSIKIKDHYFSTISKIRLVYVASLINTKNQIELLKFLTNSSLDLDLIFIGDGNNKNFLIEYSKKIPKNINIQFKGLLSREETIEHMLEADVSISLSKGEGMPIAALESLYAGCFMILSDIPPHKELALNCERCILLKSSNNYEIFNALNYVKKHLIEIRESRHLSTKFAFKNFNVDKMLVQYMNLYKEITRN